MANAAAVIAGRNFRALTFPYNVAAAVIPADTVAYGATITTPVAMTDAGYTNGGLGLNTNVERTEIRVDQEFYPVSNPITAQSFVLTTELAEMTPANLLRATGLGTLSAVAAGSGTKGHDDLAISSTVAEVFAGWMFEVQQPDLEPFRILGYRTQVTGSPSPQFTPDAPATLALEVTCLVDTGFTGYAGAGRIALVRDMIPALP